MSTLSEQVAGLERQLELEKRHCDRVQQYLKHLKQENRDLRSERDELKGRIEGLGLKLSYREGEVQHHIESQATRIPRIISAEELKVGQLVSVWGHHEPTGHFISTMGIVENINDGSVFFSGGGMWFELFEDNKDDDNTIVLLADAPESEKPATVTAEDIRNSEPGSTWEDREGETWEWDGHNLRFHGLSGRLGVVLCTVEEVVRDYVILTRSTAAPRGDYSKPELPKDTGGLVLLTEMELDGASLNEPLVIFRSVAGTFKRLDGKRFPNGKFLIHPEQIVHFKPAKVVADD